MNLTNQVMGTKEAFMDFIQNYPSDTPVVMLNILKFKATVIRKINHIAYSSLSGRPKRPSLTSRHQTLTSLSVMIER